MTLSISKVRLTHQKHTWYILVQRSTLRELYKNLKSWELLTKSVAASRGLSRELRGKMKILRRQLTTSRRESTGQKTAELEMRKNTTSNPLTQEKLDSAESVLQSAERATMSDLGRTSTSKESRRASVEIGTLDLGDDEDEDEGDDVDDEQSDLENLDFSGVPSEDKEANRRLKRYIGLFITPMFYRTDQDSLAKQREIIQSYLNDAMRHPRNRMCPDFLALLEVSATSFSPGAGPSLMEGWVKVRFSADNSDRSLRSRETRACCGRNKGVHCVCCVCFCFRKRVTMNRKRRVWAVLKPGSISTYASRTDEYPNDAMMFQPSTVVADQLSATGSMNGALIVDTTWMCELKFSNTMDQKMWTNAVKGAVMSCPYVERSRFTYESTDTNSVLADEFGSHTCQAQWFVNGKGYYSHLYDSLNAAKNQILLSGWFLSPDTYLKRPIADFPDSRIDMCIERACQRGVVCYIMVYHEAVIMNHNTKYCMDRFNGLDHRGNLFFLRHADPNIPYFWSHHDKHVTIDQEIAFVGGIDISFGRYEDSHYRLRDDNPDVNHQLWPGADFANPRIGDVEHVDSPLLDNPTHDRNVNPRMPWRDIHGCIRGTVALDVGWHFIQRWNYTRYVNKQKDFIPAILPSSLGSLALSWLDRRDKTTPSIDFDQYRSIRPSDTMNILHEMHASTWSDHALTQAKAKRLEGARKASIVEAGLGAIHSIKESVMGDEKAREIENAIRADISVETKAQKKSRRTSMKVIENLPRVEMSNFSDLDTVAEEIRPQALEQHISDDTASGGSQKGARRQSIAAMIDDHPNTAIPVTAPLLSDWGRTISENTREHEFTTESFGEFVQCKCQVVRSYSQWSCGLSETEDGIQDAYKQLIANAQHFLYIENQFFVSACGDKDTTIGNTVVNAMFNRIMKAAADDQDFRIYISIPLIPGMNGQINDTGFSGISCVMHFQYRTMSHGGNSLFERLRKHGIDPEKYCFFTGLRTHQEFRNTIETEMVYIHSKLMIVDDRKAVIGSANINDRSMMGYKDSEICMIVEDTLHVDSVMGGKPYKAGPFAKGLRMKCWSDNCGLTKEQFHLIDDPVSEECWSFYNGRAQENTRLYEAAFPGLVPTNQVRTFEDLQQRGEASEDMLSSHIARQEMISEQSEGKGKAKPRKTAHSDTIGVSTEPVFGKHAVDGRLPKAALEGVLEGDRAPFANANPMARKISTVGSGTHEKNRRGEESGIRATLGKVRGIVCEYPLDFLCDDYYKMKATVASEIFK